MTVSYHSGPDWCHLCGKRRNRLADVWYPKSAAWSKKDEEYIRICDDCAVVIHSVTLEEGK